MDYAAAISRLGEKLRDSEAWPSDSSKEDEQLYLLYNAAIAVLKFIPLARLPVAESSDITGSSTGYSDISSYDFPDDTFYFREDLGVARYILDGVEFYPTMSIPKEELLALNGNTLHNHRTMFAIDPENQLFLAMNGGTATIYYFKSPTYPTATTDTYPVPEKDNDFELAMNIVSAHVSGETIRDGGQVQFQQFLSQLYSDDTPQPQPNE